ncbi:MAG: sugar phosphorylase [Deltaproteobacteria bacterium]|nr:sugar phosphorylase [Candidatus Anaeroferrophillus wilburensis]MBN2887799.1 sugar phosphorylase [Deltaproteobacteria bacterium]
MQDSHRPHAHLTHLQEPDYSRPPYQLSAGARKHLHRRLCFIYNHETADRYLPEVERIMQIYHAHIPPEHSPQQKGYNPANRFTEHDVILITYGDLIRGTERSPLTTLEKFCGTYLEGTINTIHILPFFPYSSDRGFSIIDFATVDPKLGTWDDIADLGQHYKLMFDGVINHVSAKSHWFQEFLNGNPYYKNFFITFNSPAELTKEQRRKIFRPRTSDILVPFQTINGPAHVWATFSADQVDLNYKNPDVLMRVLEVLLLYIRRGAAIIRLDAVTFLWAEPGTRCVHLDQTHEIVKLFRDVLDAVAPHVALITETNVPHEENIAYFGNGHNEAQMVYNFALPPLVLHTFYAEDARVLSRWAAHLTTPSPTTTFFNFLDSHDGIGLMAVKNILSQEQISYLAKKTLEHGGFISYKTGSDGQDEPYEANITWFSALNREDERSEDLAFQVKRFVASRCIALVLAGVPGIYLHSLIGSRNDVEAVLKTDSKRDINRTVIDGQAITRALEDPMSKISRISRELGRLIAIRSHKRAFHPNGPQHIINLKAEVFAVLRLSPERDQHILALINVANRVIHLEVDFAQLCLEDICVLENHWYDIVSGMEWLAEKRKLSLTMMPYDIMWLESYRQKLPDRPSD